MEKRFTFKDFFLFSAVALVFLTVLLAMYMIDRQWEKMAQIEATMKEQAKDLRGLRGDIGALNRRIQNTGAAAAAFSNPEHEEIPAAFERAHDAASQSGYREGGWLSQAFRSNLKTMTPFVSEDAYAAEVQGYVLETLLRRNPDTLEWQGLLAKSWHISDDGFTITFQLRKQAKFSDGEPVTAKDVVFTFNFVMNNAIQAPRMRAYYNKIGSVTANGDHEVTFQFKEPYFKALTLAGGLDVLPEHFYAPYLKNPNQYNQSKGLLLGSGPYRLANAKTWTPDRGVIELERNPRYWGPVQPSFDRLVWKTIANDSARLTTFRNGDLDFYGARPREFKKLLTDPKLSKRTQNFDYMNPVGGYTYIGWNQKRNGKPTRFADPRVRQAITYITDRQRIIDEIYLGYAEPAVGPFNPRSPQHNSTLQPRPYDPKKAKQLFAEAGYLDRNGDGILENGDGKPFKFKLVYPQGSEDTDRLMLLLKDLYGRSGVVMNPKPTEWAVMLDVLNKRTFDAVTLAWTGSIESDLYQIFHSSQAGKQGDNFVNFKDSKLDTLIDEARATVDEDKRMPLWREAEAILYQQQPYTFMVRRKSLALIDTSIRNLKITKLGLNLPFVPVEIFSAADQSSR